MSVFSLTANPRQTHHILLLRVAWLLREAQPRIVGFVFGFVLARFARGNAVVTSHVSGWLLVGLRFHIRLH